MSIVTSAGTPGKNENTGQDVQQSSRAIKKWSIFIYVDGDNNLEKFAIEDMNEMEVVGSTDDVNIIAQVDRVTGFDRSNGDWTDTRRFYVTKDDDTEIISSQQIGESLGELNMAAPDTLRDFLEWGITNYPADHYLAVMWDHGQGIFKGFNEDMSSETQAMKLWELDEIMEYIKGVNSGKPIDLLAFDQCWLGNIETGYELIGSVDYLIASADEEPDKGWNYTRPLSKLVADPDMTSKEFAVQITNDYVEEYTNKTSYSYMTQVVIDVNEINSTFVPLMNEFSRKLIDNFYDHQSTLFGIRRSLPEYYQYQPDLYYFVKQVEANASLPTDLRMAARDLLVNYSKVILAEGHGEEHPNSLGPAIYFPDSLKYNIYSTWQAEYDSHIDFSELLWAEFLRYFQDPIIIKHEHLRDTEQTSVPYHVSARITGHILDRDNVLVHYSTNGSQFVTINTSYGNDSDVFTAEIPAQPAETHVYYYIEAMDHKGNCIYAPENAPAKALKDQYNFLVGRDIIPPEIKHQPLTNKIYTQHDFEVVVTVTDNIAIDTSKVILYFRLNNEKNYIELIMSPLRDDPSRFRAYIPSQLIGTTIYYHFTASDDVQYPNTVRLPDYGDFHFRTLGEILDIEIDEWHTSDIGDYGELFKLLSEPGHNLLYRKSQFIESTLIEETGTDEPVQESHGYVPIIDLIVIIEPDKDYTATELSVLRKYLEWGGRVLLIAGNDIEITNSLTSFMGITWKESPESVGYTSTFAFVPTIFDGVQELYYTGPELEADLKYPAARLIENDLGTSTMAAYSYHGQGKIAALSNGFFNSQSINLSNNKQCLNNLALWLMKCPLAVPLGDGSTINGEQLKGLENNTLTIWEDDFVGFDASSSLIPENRTFSLNYTWTFHDGSVSYSPDPAYRYTKKGEYEVVLMVRTYDSYMDIVRVKIIVNNGIPMAYPGYTKIVGLTVYFNGSESEDTPSDMAGLLYFWDFGDGETATGCDAVHTYSRKDVYYATLTVTDDNGASSAVTIKVDLGGDAGFSLATYYPAIAGIIILVVIMVMYFYMQRSSTKPKTRPDDNEDGPDGEERVSDGPWIPARKSPVSKTISGRTPPGQRTRDRKPPVRPGRKRL